MNYKPFELLRSANIVRDFSDPNFSKRYVTSPFILNAKNAILEGLKPGHVRRAWQIVGEYGSGKSSFAIYLANILKLKGYTPILVENNGNVVEDYLEAIGNALDTTLHKVRIKEQLEKLEKHLNTKGIILVFDEMGRYLETIAKTKDYAGLHLLQELAEFSSRSGDTPVGIITILHRNINTYLHALTESERKDWFKVSGRYEELLFPHDLNQTYRIIQAVFSGYKHTHQANIPEVKTWITKNFGKTVDSNSLKNLGPIRAELVPVILSLFANYGQNERSLFSFLYEYASTPEITISEFFTYFSRISQASPTAVHTCEFVTSFSALTETGRKYLEAIAMLQLTRKVIIDEDTLSMFFANEEFNVKHYVAELKKAKAIREIESGYVLSGNNSFNLEKSLQEEYAAVKKLTPAEILNSMHSKTILPATEFMSRTGRPTYYKLKFWETESQIVEEKEPTIHVLVNNSINKPANKNMQLFAEINFAGTLIEPVRKLCALEQIRKKYPIVTTDPVLAATIQHQIMHQTTQRNEIFRNYATCDQLLNKLKWKFGSNIEETGTRLSTYTQGILSSCPEIKNELINRKALTTPILTARNRLVKLCLNYEAKRKEKLGITKYPPELVIYHTIFEKLHNISGHYEAANIAFNAIFAAIENSLHASKTGLEILQILEAPPFGCHRPIAELLLFAFYLARQSNIFFYEDSAFVPEVESSHWDRFFRKPETFSFELIKDATNKKVIRELNIQLGLKTEGDTSLLHTVAYICREIGSLNEYARQTLKVPTPVPAIRQAILTSKSPNELLSVTLPKVINSSNEALIAAEVAKCIKVLKYSYAELITTIGTVIFEAIPHKHSQKLLQTWGTDIKYTTNPQALKALASRLADDLPQTSWLESIATLLSGKSPERWHDRETETFLDLIRLKLQELYMYMLRKNKNLEAYAMLQTEIGDIFAPVEKPNQTEKTELEALVKGLSADKKAKLLYLLLANE